MRLRWFILILVMLTMFEIAFAIDFFEIWDNDGDLKAWFGSNGLAGFVGTCTYGGDCSGAPANSLKIKDDAGNIKAYVDDNGNACVEGDYFPSVGVLMGLVCNPPGQIGFRIEDDSGVLQYCWRDDGDFFSVDTIFCGGGLVGG